MHDQPSPATPSIGKLIKEYKQSAKSERGLVFIMLFCCAFPAVFLLPAWFDPSVPGLVGQSCLSMWGVFLLLPFFLGAQKLIRFHGVSFRVYDNGLIYQVRGKETRITWIEVCSFFQDST